MAFFFDNDYRYAMTRTGSVISNGDPRPVSVAFWFKATAYQNQLVFSNSWTLSPAFGAFIYYDASKHKIRLYSVGNASDSTGVAEDTAWHHYGASWISASNATAFFIDGTSDGTGSLVAGAAQTTGAVVGGLGPGEPGYDVNGHLCELAVWSAQLDAQEFAALGKGASPLLIRPHSLALYLPMVRPINEATAPVAQDRVSSDAWSQNSASYDVTASSHPRVFYHHSRLIYPVAVGPITLAGTSSLTFGTTAQSSVAVPLAGTSGITFGTTAQSSVSVPIAGTSTITFGTAAALDVSTPGAITLAGTADLIFGTAGESAVSGSAIRSLAGTAALTFGTTADTAVAVPLAATSALVFGTAGALNVVTASVTLAGTSGITFTTSGETFLDTVYYAGTAALVFATTAALYVSGLEVPIGAINLRCSTADPVLRCSTADPVLRCPTADPILRVYLEEAWS